jgi:hypothetical protein
VWEAVPVNPLTLSTRTPLQRALARYYMDTIREEAIKSAGLHRAGLQWHLPDRTLPRREFDVLELEITMRDGASLYFYGSLGDSLAETGADADHEHEFMVLTDLHSEDVALLVAEARAHHTLVAPLDVHHSFLLGEDSPSRRTRLQQRPGRRRGDVDAVQWQGRGAARRETCTPAVIAPHDAARNADQVPAGHAGGVG